MKSFFKAFPKTFRFFSYQNKLKTAQDQYGVSSPQALEAQLAYAWDLLTQKKIQEAKDQHSQAAKLSSQVFGDKTLEKSVFLSKIGKSYELIGDLDSSLSYYLQSYQIESVLKPADSEDLLFSVNRIGAMYADVGDIKNAEEFLSKIFKQVEKSLSFELKAVYFGNLGHIKMRLGDRENSLKYFLIAKENQEKFAPEDPIMIKYLQSLGMCYWVHNEYESSKNYFLKALKLLNPDTEDNRLKIVDIYSHLAYLHNDMKNPTEMNNYFNLAIETFLTANAEDKNEKIAEYIKNISETMKSVGDLSNSQLYLQKLVDFTLENFGENSKWLANTYQQFSSLHLTMQNSKEAINYAEKSFNIRNSFENNHFDLLYSYNQFAAIYHTIGNLDLAEKYLGLTTDILKTHPSNSLKTSHYHNLALLYRDKKDFPAAESNMLSHIEGVISQYGEKHPGTAAAYSGLGHIYRLAGKFDKSLEIYHKALMISDSTLGREHISTCDYLDYLGEMYRGTKNFTKALEFHNEDLAIRTKLLGKNHISLHIPYYNLAVTFLDMKDFANATKYCIIRLDLFKGMYGETHNYTAGSYAFLGEIYIKSGKKDQAIQALTNAKAILISLKNESAAAGIEKKILELKNSQ